jgi:hypothetical protein
MGKGGDSDTLVALGITGFCAVFITSIVLFSVSFGVINPTAVGIVYDHNTQHIESDKLYGGGRYLVGLGREFITFPTTWSTIKMGNFAGADAGALSVRGADGFIVTIEVSFQYVVSDKIEDLVRLYLDFGGTHKSTYIKTAQAVIRDVASNYQAFDFFTSRTLVSQDMQEALNHTFHRLYARVPYFQLVNMAFDTQFATAIEETQIAYQDIQKAQYEQRVQQVQADNSVQVAQSLANITIVTATATATSHLAQIQAEANALKYRVIQQTAGLSELRSKLNLTSNQDLLAYSFVTAIKESGVTDMNIAMQYPEIIQEVIS